MIENEPKRRWYTNPAVVLIGILAGAFIFGGSSESSESVGGYEEYNEYEDVEYLAYEHWDEVREYMSGTETIDACSNSVCYSFDADIHDGYINTLYFPNGGYIYPDAEIGESGFAEGYDYEGNYWEFQIDLDSDTVQDAISEWASDFREDYE